MEPTAHGALKPAHKMKESRSLLRDPRYWTMMLSGISPGSYILIKVFTTGPFVVIAFTR